MATAKESKTTAAEADPGPRLDTIRPGEIGVRSSNGRVLLSDPALNRGYYDNWSWGVLPGVVCVVPGRLRAEALRVGLEVVDDAVEGVIPPRVNVSDGRQRQIFRDGKVSVDRDVLLNDYRRKYLSWSLGESIFLLVEAGWDEAVAAEILVREYDDSFLRGNGDATRRSWVTLGQQLLEQTRRRTAENDPAQPAPEGRN